MWTTEIERFQKRLQSSTDFRNGHVLVVSHLVLPKEVVVELQVAIGICRLVGDIPTLVQVHILEANSIRHWHWSIPFS